MQLLGQYLKVEIVHIPDLAVAIGGTVAWTHARMVITGTERVKGSSSVHRDATDVYHPVPEAMPLLESTAVGLIPALSVRSADIIQRAHSLG